MGSSAVAGGSSTLSLSPQMHPGNWPVVASRQGAYAYRFARVNTLTKAGKWRDYESGLLSVTLG